MYVGETFTTESNFTVQLNGRLSVVSSLLQAVSDNHQHYTLSLFLSCVYTLFLFPVGFLGNVLILVVNLGNRGRLTAPDLYFVNLAAADLILVADSLIEVFNLKQGYYDKAALCTFMVLFQQVNMYSSVFFLTWMSFDRFVVLSGCTGGRSVRHARLSCCLIWVSASLLTVLPFAVAQAQHAGELHFCFINVSQIQWLEVTLGFLLPFCVMGLCYWRIGRVLLRSQQLRPRRQKALRMISAAVVVFFLCWLPQNIFVSAHLVKGEADGSTLWHDYPLTGHAVNLAAFSNSCLNPLIYSFLGETFQDKLRIFFRQNARWVQLHRSASANSACLPSANTCSHAACKEASRPMHFLQNTRIVPQPLMFPSNKKLHIVDHKHMW